MSPLKYFETENPVVVKTFHVPILDWIRFLSMLGHGMGEGKQIQSRLVNKTYDGKDLVNFPSRKSLLRYELL